MPTQEPRVATIFWPFIFDLCEESGVDCSLVRSRLGELVQTHGDRLPVTLGHELWEMICPFDSANPALPVQISEIIRPYRVGHYWAEYGSLETCVDLVRGVIRQQAEVHREVCEYQLLDNRIVAPVLDPDFQNPWQHKACVAGFLKGLSEFLLDKNVLTQIGFDFPKPPADVDWDAVLGCPVRFGTPAFHMDLDAELLNQPLPVTIGLKL